MISVILPTYNGDRFLRETVESVLAQTGDVEYELVISDDGSTDDTVDVIRSFDDDRITFVTNDGPAGVAPNTNRAVEAASGDLLAFVDQDDVWHTDKLRDHRDAHERHDADLVYSDLSYVDADGRDIGRERLPDPNHEDLLCQVFSTRGLIPTLSCVSVRRERFESVGGFDASISVACDFDFYAGLVAAGASFARCPAELVAKRVHDDNTVHSFRAMYEDRMTICDRYGDAVPDALRRQFLAESYRDRASWELQDGNPRAAGRFLLRALRHKPQTKALLLLGLVALDAVSGPASLGHRVHQYYLTTTSRRRQ